METKTALKNIERPYTDKLKEMLATLQTDIDNADIVFIAPHKKMDLDAIASAAAVSKLVTKLGKRAYIVTNDNMATIQEPVHQLYTRLQKTCTFINTDTLALIKSDVTEEELIKLANSDNSLVLTALRLLYREQGLKKMLEFIPQDDMDTVVKSVKKEEELGILTKYSSLVLYALSEMINPDKTKELLITIDTNKRSLIYGVDILEKIPNIIVIDHHYPDETTIQTDKMLIDTTVSSASHIMTDVLEAFDVEIDAYLAYCLMAGIYLDTNRLLKKNSFEIAMTIAKLMKYGADADEVNKLFAINDFELDRKNKKLVDKLIDDAVFNKYDIAIAMNVDNPETLYEDDTILARVADDLLQYQNVAASFAIGFIDKAELGEGHKNKIAIKGRSNNKFDIASIMHYFGGGGEDGRGACVIRTDNIEGVKAALCMLLSQGFHLVESEATTNKLLQLLPEIKK